MSAKTGTDEERWLARYNQTEPHEVARMAVDTESGPLIARRLETEGRPSFSIEFGEVTCRLTPPQTLRLVQMLVGLADLGGGK